MEEKSRRPAQAMNTAKATNSSFCGVSYHKGKEAFVARVRTKKGYKMIGGLHASPAAAAETLRRKMLFPGIDVLRRGKKDQRADPFRARFCALAKIYCQPSNMFLQGGLEATQRQKKDTVLSKIFQEEAGLEEVCDLAKYGPIKDHLVAAYQKIRRPAAPGGQSPEERAQCLYKVLVDTAHHFSGINLKTPWVENCGRFVSQHSGFVPLLARLNVAQKWRPGDRGPKLDFSGIGGTPEPRTLLPAQASARQLLALIKGADARQSIPLPKNSQEWLAALRNLKATKKIQKQKHQRRPRDKKTQKAYLKLWHLRSHWYPRIAAGVHAKHFHVKGVSLRDFSSMFPDSGNWILRLAPRTPYTVKGLFAKVGYRAHPVLFSCFACLFADAGVAKYSAEQILESLDRLKQGLGQYRSQHGIWPHPAILLQKVLGEETGSGS